MRTTQYFFSLLIAVFFLTTQSSIAQVTWMQSSSGSCISAEYRDAVGLDDGGDDGFALMLNGRYRFSPTLQSIFQMPVSYANIADDFFYPGGSSFYIGNLYFGIEGGKADQSSGIFQAGLRIPTADVEDFADFMAANYGVVLVYEQFEAFIPKTLSVQGAGGFRSVKLQDGVIQWRWETLIGGTFMKPENVDGELFGDLNTAFWLYTSHVRFGFGGIMRAIISEEVDNLGDRINIQGGISVVGVFGQMRPYVATTIPLSDDLTETYDLTFSIGLGVDFGGTNQSSQDIGL
jgi:hypothetical protein